MHNLPDKDHIGRYPVGTVWFSSFDKAWLRRTEPCKVQILAWVR